MNRPLPTPAQQAILRRNNVVVQGHDQGRLALVFVNGFGCEQSMWRSVAPHFAPNHRVVLFVAVLTGLQFWLNPSSGGEANRFRVGFLPVT